MSATFAIIEIFGIKLDDFAVTTNSRNCGKKYPVQEFAITTLAFRQIRLPAPQYEKTITVGICQNQKNWRGSGVNGYTYTMLSALVPTAWRLNILKFHPLDFDAG
ncbi:hypothetical protein FACS1894170_04390 [Planctomycetales bacterium]|nr:hypothetical protein FACS1894170_04390 [Planctomycetales bacterium]